MAAVTDPRIGWMVDDEGEPDLGWTGHARGCAEDEPRDDREGGDECEVDGDENDFDGGKRDTPGFIGGGNEGFGPSVILAGS